MNAIWVVSSMLEIRNLQSQKEKGGIKKDEPQKTNLLGFFNIF
jgi:hypothetical protein